MAKIKTSISIKPTVLSALRKEAKKEGRTLSNYLDQKLATLAVDVSAELSRSKSAKAE
jgi:hypothetical protein